MRTKKKSKSNEQCDNDRRRNVDEFWVNSSEIRTFIGFLDFSSTLYGKLKPNWIHLDK